MSHSEILSFASAILFQHLGSTPRALTSQRLTGGCINESFKISTSEGHFFLKFNQPDFEIQFEKEARALALLRNTRTLRVPEVLRVGNHNSRAFLLMEYITPEKARPDFWKAFGSELANLHRTTTENQSYGLDFDNYIGELPQKNTFKKNWIDFFIENRLEVQVTLALSNKLIDGNFLDRFRKIYVKLEGLLTKEPPSLIHGDLWSGNFLCGQGGTAVLIDPATYYGNREIELAFTQLFGGFSQEFYETYQSTWPLQPGFSERAEIYNLYPLLVHVNLFGKSYLSGIERVVRRYV